MNAHTTRMASGATREQVSGLLARYPDVTAEDSSTILDFLRTGRHLDIGLLTADEALKPNLDSFMEDHKAHFRVRSREVFAVLGGIGALLLVLWLLWEAFS